MKIAIFGDSYAAPINTDCGRYKSWPYYLQNLNNYEITNYAVEGSSFQYSAQLFLDNYKEYDKIIFVITHPGRLYLSDPAVYSKFRHLAGLPHIDYFSRAYKQVLLSSEKASLPYLNAAREYYMYLFDVDQVNLMHTALYEKLVRVVPPESVLWLPCILPSIGSNDTNITTLSDISFLDGFPPKGMEDHRCNHLNDTNNFILASKINRWIGTSEFQLNISDYQTAPLDQPLWRPL